MMVLKAMLVKYIYQEFNRLQKESGCLIKAAALF